MELGRMVKDYRDAAMADSLQTVLEHQRTGDGAKGSPENDDAQLGRLMRAHELAAASLRKYFDRKGRMEAETRMRPLAFGGVRP